MGEIGLVNAVGGAGQRPCVCLGRRLSDLSLLSEEWLSAAEEAAQQVVNCVRPTLDSEEKRRDIIDHLQRLVNGRLNCEIFPYGSVPLKTYLPDGDIDLTAIKTPNTEKSLAHEVLAVLQREEMNENAEFQVRDTQFIDAEVKLVKCLVRNIVIDISFNQLGGLSTLCFLEQIDRLVGRNHMFKRSIILVKTWCYYESRILGAHHGLISTYALETLVLYIFHLFHSSLSGPLAVLYKFLDYYGQFDWENYCVSLKGPVRKSSLPDIVVETTESGWNNRMFSEEFLENCIEMFSFTSRMLEGNSKAFQVKHLNIVDPLKDNNNLGRSVSRGNFFRIRSAFKYGARRLGQILSGPKYKLVEEINKFFANALARHGNDNRHNSIQCLSLEWDDEESLSVSVSSPLEFSSKHNMPLKSSVSDADDESVGLECKSSMDRELPLGMSFDKHSSVGVVSGHHIKRESNGITTSNSRMRVGTPDFSPSSNGNLGLSWKNSRALPPMFSKFSVQIGSLEPNDLHPSDLGGNASHNYSSLPLDTRGHGQVNDTYQWCMDNSQAACKIRSSPIVKAKFLDHPSVEFREAYLKSIGGESEVFNPLADLSGDYDSHIRSLLYGQLCHGFSLSTSAVYHPPLSPSRHEIEHLCDNASQPVLLPQDQFSDTSSQPLSVKQSMIQAPDYTLPAAAFHAEGTQKNSFIRERPAQGRGRSKVPGKHLHNQSNRYSHGNGMSRGLDEQSYLANGYHDVLPARSRSLGRGKLNAWCQSPRSVGDRNGTGDCSSGLYKIEFGSFGSLAERLISASTCCQDSSPDVSPETQGKPVATKQERREVPSVHLKNKAEFPLSIPMTRTRKFD